MITAAQNNSVLSMDAAIACMHHKALEFFRNFISCCTDRIDKYDTFKLLVSHANGDLIRNTLMINQETIDSDITHPIEKKLQNDWNTALDHEPVRTRILNALDKILESEIIADNPFPGRLEEIRKVLGFDDLELNFILLGFLEDEGILDLPVERRTGSSLEGICEKAHILKTTPEKLHKALIGSGKLHRLKCVTPNLEYSGIMNFFLLGLNEAPISTNYFYQDDLEDVLPWGYFDNLAAEHGVMLKQMIASCGAEKPMNILLYGEPGTGKTSFARTLAKELGKKCYMLSQSIQLQGKHDSSIGSRFAALDVCCGQVEPEKSIIIVDEADEMLAENKGQLNDALDALVLPVIWIANTAASALNLSSRRRFDYSICFEKLDAEQRFKIWKNGAARFQLQNLLNEEQMRTFSKRYAVSAGGISLVLKNIAQLKIQKENVESTVQHLMKQHCELMGVEQQKKEIIAPAKDYTLKGLNIQSGVKLDRIVSAAKRFQECRGNEIDQPRMNILLSGVPGAGKTEFVKYLGQTLDSEIIVKMGSDLLDKYVGETEKNIRNAFEEAEEKQAILFLDEIDGMLQNRENAEKGWEVSPVNELLHRMENYKGIFIGATNFNKRLDPAVMRRFTFKLEFGYLDDQGKSHFFEHMFQTKLTDSERLRLNSIEHLTPGDFRTVRQGIFYLGDAVTNDERLQMLEAESLAKTGKDACVKARNRIGF